MRHTLIIAEAGVNHNGDLKTAYRMIEVAKTAGADIVKFQTAKAEKMISRYAEKAEYQKRNTGESESQLDMVRKLMFPFEYFEELKNYCGKCGIGFLSTPFDSDSIDYLEGLGCDLWKIPSGEITNLPYLTKIAHTKRDVIMSTGMSDLDEIGAAMAVLRENGSGSITLLHCNTQYPTLFEDVNLNAMLTMRSYFGVPVGYSDHTMGIEVAIAAVAMGAVVIEKHFTLDRNAEGPDHKASLEPDELKEMIKSIRHVEQAMGDGVKRASRSEISNMRVARKSIVASKEIHKGEIFTEDNLTSKRPGNGISPMRWFEVLGQKAKREFREDEMIEL